jgi:ABC-2 type transport system permease protein
MKHFSWQRLWGIILKELTQFKRDHSTFALVIFLPIVQLILFGLAINTNPKNLPSAIVNFDSGPFARSLWHGLENTGYFKFNHAPATEQAAQELMDKHQVLFTLHIPSDFSNQLIRGKQPQALLEVDGTDPVSVAYALSAGTTMMNSVFQYDLVGNLQGLAPASAPAQLVIHNKYNPSIITQYNIVPGLLGTVLTMTFVLVASMALTRERERGTLESLLATPVTPLEVIIGKSMPFILVGYLQTLIVLIIAVTLFAIPMRGSVTLLMFLCFPFILANLFVGMMMSTIAKTQLEASQVSIFFFFPSLLLSGFAFPFYGMPLWAQFLGHILPLTHFINIVRGIMLKGLGVKYILIDLWPILIFLLVVLVIAIKRYRQTLD